MNRVLGHFCDFFLEKWSKIWRFSGSERSCWDTFAIFFWRNGPRLGVSLVQNGCFGTLLRFFVGVIKCSFSLNRIFVIAVVFKKINMSKISC